MTRSARIILFEDNPQTAMRLLARIAARFKSTGRAVLFEPKIEAAGKDLPYEDRLADEVAAAGFDKADLWVTDRDLSRIATYQGLSEAVVSKVAAQFGIPVCKYARGVADDDVFRRQRNWGASEI